MTTLYERLGGKEAVFAAVDGFYAKVLADDRIAGFFADTDMEAQKGKQRAFLVMAFGGPNHYTGLDMTAAHAPLVERGLDDGHVDAVLEHLGSTLDDLGAAEGDRDEVLSLAGGLRDAVLGRAPAGEG